MNLWRIGIDEDSGKVLTEPQAVTTGVAVSSQHPSLSSDGTRIAYEAETDTTNIYQVTFDPSAETVEGEAVPITQGFGRAFYPDPSPDSTWLAYSSWGAKQEDIFVIRPDGTGRRHLTDDLHKDRGPRWSPDGKRIAFYSNRSGQYEIWTINADGSGLEQLTTTPGAVLHPVWSPDGKYIMYSSFASGSYLIELGKPWNEQGPQALPALDNGERLFIVRDWSPDGQRLAGESRRVGGTGDGIVIYSVESQQYRTLTDFGIWPRWLSDGRRLLFWADRKIFLLDVPSGEHRELFSADQVGWSALGLAHDDRTIYFSIQTKEADIWMLTLNEAKD
jgi:Tol biopolymer transport system component